jgi:hypothetical protein
MMVFFIVAAAKNSNLTMHKALLKGTMQDREATMKMFKYFNGVGTRQPTALTNGGHAQGN